MVKQNDVSVRWLFNASYCNSLVLFVIKFSEQCVGNDLTYFQCVSNDLEEFDLLISPKGIFLNVVPFVRWPVSLHFPPPPICQSINIDQVVDTYQEN